MIVITWRRCLCSFWRVRSHCSTAAMLHALLLGLEPVGVTLTATVDELCAACDLCIVVPAVLIRLTGADLTGQTAHVCMIVRGKKKMLGKSIIFFNSRTSYTYYIVMSVIVLAASTGTFKKRLKTSFPLSQNCAYQYASLT